MAAPLIEAADCTVSGSNTAAATWAVSHPACSTGDLLIWNIAWDDSTTTTDVAEPAGSDGETLTEINATAIASASTEVRGKCWYTVCTAAWSAGTLTFTPNATESWTATVIRVPAGEFDATTPIGASNTRASAGATETDVLSPAITAGATDGGGTVVWFAFADADPLGASNPTGWTIRQRQDLGAVAHGVATRNAATTDNESIAGGDVWTIAGDSWASVGYIVRGTIDTWSATGAPALPLLTASGSGEVGTPGQGGDPAPLPHLGLLLGGAATFSGSGAPTLPLLTASGAGKKERKGTGAPNLPLVTASGAGKKERKGTGAPSLPLLTAAGVAKRALKATGAASLPLLTASGSGTSAEDVSEGSGAPSLPLLTASGAGKKERKGTGAPTLPLLTAAGAGTKTRKGTGTPSLPLLTADGSGSITVPTDEFTGSGTPTLPLLTASGAGKKERKGTGTPALPILTAAGAGKKERKGTGAATLPLLTAAGSGKKARKGTGSPSLPLLTAAGSGKKARAGTGSPSLPLVTASGSGAAIPDGVFAGSGAVTLPILTAAGTAKRALLGSGAVTLPLLTADGAGTAPIQTEEAASGGWLAYNDAERARHRRKRQEREEAEELAREVRALERHLVAEKVLAEPSEPVDAARLRKLAEQYRDGGLLDKRAQRALAYAERAKTELSVQLALRELQRQAEDEEFALLMLLAAD